MHCNYTKAFSRTATATTTTTTTTLILFNWSSLPELLHAGAVTHVVTLLNKQICKRPNVLVVIQPAMSKHEENSSVKWHFLQKNLIVTHRTNIFKHKNEAKSLNIFKHMYSTSRNICPNHNRKNKQFESKYTDTQNIDAVWVQADADTLNLQKAQSIQSQTDANTTKLITNQKKLLILLLCLYMTIPVGEIPRKYSSPSSP